MDFYVNDAKVSVEEGQIIFINSLTIHTSEAIPGLFTKMCKLQFCPSLIFNTNISDYKYLTPFIYHKSFSYHLFSDTSTDTHKLLANLMTGIAIEFSKKGIAYELQIKSNLYGILSLLYREGILKSNMTSDLDINQAILIKLETVLRYIDENYSENISLKKASAIMKLNYHYFCRLFKTATGKTFVEYINFVRVSVAENLLLTTDKTITDIFFETGFSSSSHFSKIFKSIKGFSPSNYRQKFKSR